MDAASPNEPPSPSPEPGTEPDETSPRQQTWSKLISLTAELALAAIPRQRQVMAAQHALATSVPRAEIESAERIADELFLRLEEHIYGPISTHQTLALIGGARLSGYEAASTDLQHWSPIAYHPRFVAATHGDLRLVHKLLDGMTDLPAVATVPTGKKNEADTRPTGDTPHRQELAKILRFPTGFSDGRRVSSLERFGPASNGDPNASIVPPANPERNLRAPGRHTAVLVSPFSQNNGAASLLPPTETKAEGPLFPTSSERPFEVDEDVPVHALDTSSAATSEPHVPPPVESEPAATAASPPGVPDNPPDADEFSVFFEEELEEQREEESSQTPPPEALSPSPASPRPVASTQDDASHQPTPSEEARSAPDEPRDPTEVIVKIMLAAAFVGIIVIVSILMLLK